MSNPEVPVFAFPLWSFLKSFPFLELPILHLLLSLGLYLLHLFWCHHVFLHKSEHPSVHTARPRLLSLPDLTLESSSLHTWSCLFGEDAHPTCQLCPPELHPVAMPVFSLLDMVVFLHAEYRYFIDVLPLFHYLKIWHLGHLCKQIYPESSRLH